MRTSYTLLALVFASLSAVLAAPVPAPAPAPAPANSKTPTVLAVVPPSSSSDPVAAALASKLAEITKSIGKIPVNLPGVPDELKTGSAGGSSGGDDDDDEPVVVKPRPVANRKYVPKNPKTSKGSSSKARRSALALAEPAALPARNPKNPAEALPGNPKHRFLPNPPIKVIPVTFTLIGEDGKAKTTVVVDGQGSWTHPGAPKPTGNA